MAEYVRRKRPPGSHPHWARLHDLTHPTPVGGAFVCLGISGTLAGAYCGFQEAITFSSAMRQASECALYLAAFFGLGGFLTTLSDRRPTRTWATIGMALLMTLLIFAFAYAMLFLLFSVMFSFRWLTGGLGWYWGAAVGLGIGLLLAAFFAFNERRTWRRRQRRWPRWEPPAEPRRVPEPNNENTPYEPWTPPPEPVIQPEPVVQGNATNVT